MARRLPEYEFPVAGGARPEGDGFEFAERIRNDAPENVTVTGPLDDEECWTPLAAPDLALLPYRVVTQSGTFNPGGSGELPVLASDVDYSTRIQSRWGTPETPHVANLDDVVDHVRTPVENETRRRQLADAIRRYRRVNSFERVGTTHCRIYRHFVVDTVDRPGDQETGGATRLRPGHAVARRL